MKILIIDTRVADYQTFIDSLNSETTYVLLEYYNDTYQSLLQKINDVSMMNTIESIALVSHSVIGRDYQMLDSEPLCKLPNVEFEDPSLSSWTEWKQFWFDLGAPIIDLLGCALYIDENWRYVLNTLEIQMGVDFRASIDDTGALVVGGNWILESDNVNVKDVYFTEEIEGWSGLLGGSMSGAISYIDSSGILYARGTPQYAGHFTSVPIPISYFTNMGKEVQYISLPKLTSANVAFIVTNGIGTSLDNSNGELWMVGSNANGKLGDGTTTTAETPIQIFDSGCTYVSCGSNHTAAIRNGALWTWGLNTNGQLGDGTMVSKNYPVQPVDNSGSSTITLNSGCTRVECGNNFTVVLCNGGIFTFGLNTNRQLGDGTTINKNYPVRLKNSSGTDILTSGVIQISVGSAFSAARTSGGALWSWGLNSSGQLGTGNTTTPTNPSNPFATGCTNVECGSATTYLVRSGLLYAFGSNSSNVTGTNISSTSSITSTTTLCKDASGNNISNPISVKAGNTHCMIINSQGGLMAAGSNAEGQLSRTNEVKSNNIAFEHCIESLITNSTITSGCTALFSGANMNYFIRNNLLYGVGQATNFSQNHYYLNPLMVTSQFRPVEFFRQQNKRVHKVSIGKTHHAFIVSNGMDSRLNESNGELWLLGSNDFGALGTGGLKSSTISTLGFVQTKDASGNIILNSGCTDVACGENFTIVVCNNRVYTFGFATLGSLGRGTTLPDNPREVLNSSTNPVPKFTSGTIKVFAGAYNSGVIQDGALWLFGGNISGQIGNRTNTSQLYPVQCRDLSNNILFTSGCTDVDFGAQSVGQGKGHTAVVCNGALWTIGHAFYGQLGNRVSGTTDLSFNYPVQPKDINGNVVLQDGVTAVRCGQEHTSVIQNGSLWSFGNNSSGLLMDGTTVNKDYPVRSVDSSNNITLLGNITNIATNNLTFVMVRGILYSRSSSAPWHVTISSTESTPNRLLNENTITQFPLELSGNISVSSILYGQPLSAVSISGIYRDPYTLQEISGTFVFDSPSSIPEVGTQSYIWSFIPNDTTYETKYSSSSITVIGKIDPVILGSVSVNQISFGQDISSSGINGTFIDPNTSSIVTGSITFDDPTTKPNVGTSSYAWTFRPDASNNYNNQEGLIAVTVTYASDNSGLNDVINDIFANTQDTSASLVVTSTIFETDSYLTTSAYVDASQSTLNTVVYTTSDVSFSFVPPAVPQNATVTTNPYRDISYNLGLTDLSSGYNLIITPIQPAYFVSPDPAKTVDFAFAYRVIDTATGTYVTTLQYPIQTIIEIMDITAYNYTIYHLDTTTGIVSPVTSAIVGNTIEFTITKNNVLFGSSVPVSNIPPATINLPFIFDLSAQSVTIFGEDVSVPDASFNLSVDMSASIFRQSLLYRDSETDEIDISFTPVSGNLEYEINRLNTTNGDSYNLTLSLVTGSLFINYTQFSKNSSSNVPPENGPLHDHFIQYIASLMFGHPQAQAPIKNDSQIITDLSNGNLGLQFASALGDASNVRQSIFEQLISSDISNNRFDISDTEGPYLPYPFIPGDKIIFRVAMHGTLYIDGPSSLPNVSASTTNILYKLFNGITGIDFTQQQPVIESRYWKIIITLV